MKILTTLITALITAHITHSRVTNEPEEGLCIIVPENCSQKVQRGTGVCCVIDGQNQYFKNDCLACEAVLFH